MAYWWVSQNKTYQQERDGGYLWAPKSGASATVPHHWLNMTLVRPGDIIFSYAAQAIGAFGVALTTAYNAPQPAEFKGIWEPEGRKVDVLYRITRPIPLGTIVDDLIPYLPKRNSPITSTKKGVQGYLFAIPPKAGRLICDRLNFAKLIDKLVADTLGQTVLNETTVDALVQARNSQA